MIFFSMPVSFSLVFAYLLVQQQVVCPWEERKPVKQREVHYYFLTKYEKSNISTF